MLLRLREWKAGVCNRASAFHQSLAFHLQDPGIVVLFLLLCYLDIMLGTQSSLTGTAPSDTIAGTRNAIMCIQAFELLLQLITFHVRFFSHWGYAFDTALVATRFLNKNGITSVDEQQLILLSFLRVWRFVQVVAAYVDIEASKHNRTKTALAAQAKSADAWRTEVETLKEALQLAALDVAAAAINPTQSGRVSPTDSAEAESKGEGGSSSPRSDTLAEGSSTGGIAME